MRYVYVLKNLVNGKVYVGQTYNVDHRKAGHFSAARNGNFRPLYQSIRKHGESNFVIEILEECDDSIIDERETFWIAHFDSRNAEKGYNLAPGGKGVSNQTRIKLSEVNKGRNNPMFGHVFTSESLYKVGSGHRGKRFSESHRQNLRLSRGDQHGERNPTFGKKGANHPSAKLTSEQASEIRSRTANGEKYQVLALEYGVSRFTISRIANRILYA